VSLKEFLIHVGKRVRQERRRQGLSQTDLALRAGVEQRAISEIETGRRAMTLSTLHKLARALEVEPAQLIAE
jgi:HTH-type transcriptional regulator, competence development regulator